MFDTFQFIFFINKILNHKSIDKIYFFRYANTKTILFSINTKF